MEILIYVASLISVDSRANRSHTYQNYNTVLHIGHSLSHSLPYSHIWNYFTAIIVAWALFVGRSGFYDRIDSQ